jgi:hypothetical protein
MHASIHPCTHTYIHTYIHTCTQSQAAEAEQNGHTQHEGRSQARPAEEEEGLRYGNIGGRGVEADEDDFDQDFDQSDRVHSDEVIG